MVKLIEKGGVQTLLTPIQVRETEEQVRSLEKTAQQAHVQNPGMLRQRVQSLKAQLEESAPKPYADDEIDAAVRREKELREDMIADGMPTAQEMRKAPPGAESKHRNWNKRNDAKINEWKHIQLRRNAGSNEYDSANIEMFRPTGSGSTELSMDIAFIPG